MKNTLTSTEVSRAENTGTPPTTTEQKIATKASEVGAAYMLPPHEMDSPLTAEEIAPRFGAPVIAKGVNYVTMAYEYLRVVRGEVLGKYSASPSAEPTLRALAENEHQATMEFNFRILRDHDSQAHRKADISRFEKYVAGETGEVHSRSTLIRRMVHIKFALLAAAAGAIDTLPSQNQANMIGRLPRNHWVRFWRDIQGGATGKRIGKAALEEAVYRYAGRNELPMRGTRLDMIETLPEPAPLQDPQLDSSNHPTVQPSARELEQRLLSVFESELPQCLSERTKKRAKKAPLARSYLTALRAVSRKPQNETELENHCQLFRLISENHPDLGRRLMSRALALAFAQIQDKLK